MTKITLSRDEVEQFNLAVLFFDELGTQFIQGNMRPDLSVQIIESEWDRFEYKAKSRIQKSIEAHSTRIKDLGLRVKNQADKDIPKELAEVLHTIVDSTTQVHNDNCPSCEEMRRLLQPKSLARARSMALAMIRGFLGITQAAAEE